MKISWRGASLLVLGLLGVGMFGYSLTQQTAIQRQMNDTMAEINHSILSTGQVVAQTAIVLQPLAATTAALSSIGNSEKTTTAHLASMNVRLKNIGDTEQRIVTSLDTLNSSTGQVKTTLIAMQSVGTQLYSASMTSLQQANQEATGVGNLNHMTDTSIAQLHQLNSKLSALRLLP